MTRQYRPYIFDDFFASGMEEDISPFLTKSSKNWAKKASLKIVIIAAFFLLTAFITLFFQKDLSFFFLSFSYFIIAPPALIHAFNDIKNWHITIDTLMTTAAMSALIIGSPYEGALLLVLFQGAGALEHLVTHQAKSAIYSLHQLVPKTVDRIHDGVLEKKLIQEIQHGDLIIVTAGETIPCDGIVTEGSSHVDLSHITGEHTPIFLQKKNQAISGSKVIEGRIVLKVQRTGNQTTLMQLLELITNAQKNKPPVEKRVQKYSKKYAPFLIISSCLVALLLPLFSSIPYMGKTGSVYRALSYLIAASPCALILGIPIAYFSAISATLKKGILIKGGAFLDILEKTRYIAFDKTGTLTTNITCTSFESIETPSISPKKALSIIQALTRESTHPFSRSIRDFSKEASSSAHLVHFTNIPGKGIEGKVSLGHHIFSVRLGNQDFLVPHLSPSQKKSLKLLQDQETVFVLIEQDLYFFTFEETVKKNLSKTITRLVKDFHMTPLILTGDKELAAKKIAHILGINTYYSKLAPDEKLKIIADLSRKKPLAMVGDGINDAPALARADVGIALGKLGSSAAYYASDIVFLHDDLSLLPWLFHQAKKTKHILMQNLLLSILIISAASCFALIDWIPIWSAVLLHEGSTLLVGINSLRLLKK